MAVDEKSYEYEVAFSFLARDEPLARQLNDLLQDRLKIFLYSERQKEIAGQDGEKKFNYVFGEQARCVVVLYRDGWGTTPWTRIEETAIRNRAFEAGFDFVKFIPLDEPASVPKWLPKTQLWIGLKRWGAEGAASVIEARVQELGGQPHEETVLDKAARISRSMAFAKKREQALSSEAGVKAFVDGCQKALEHLKEEIEHINNTTDAFKLQVASRHHDNTDVYGLKGTMVIHHYHAYANTLRDASLSAKIYVRPLRRPGPHSQEPVMTASKSFEIDYTPSDGFAWIEKGVTKHTYTSKELASEILKFYLSHS